MDKVAEPINLKVLSNIQFNTEWDFRQGNFSLLKCGTYYLAIIRLSNIYTTDVGHFRRPPSQQTYRTANVALKLDLNFKPISIPITFFDKTINASFHVEDIRLFRYKGEIWGSFAVRPLNSIAFTMGFACLEGILQGKQVSTIYLVKPFEYGNQLLTYESGKDASVFPVHYHTWEKNWMPIDLFPDTMTFVYNVSPLILVTVIPEQNKISYSQTPIRGSMRGSSQFIRWRNGWLGVVHYTLWRSQTLRDYEHQLVYMTEDDQLYSPTFTLLNPQIEFINCLLPGKDDDTILVCLGECDEYSRIVQLQLSDVWPNFKA